jgi:Streptomyces sporulation and cell division protein, SsgA
MITELARHRVRARPVGERGSLAYGGYMYLVYDVTRPFEVCLAGSGDGDGELFFGRDLLMAALDGHPSGEGDVRARLQHFRAARHSQLVLAVTGDEGSREWAIGDDAASDFLRATTDLVPLGEEGRYLDLDAVVAALLEDAS